MMTDFIFKISAGLCQKYYLLILALRFFRIINLRYIIRLDKAKEMKKYVYFIGDFYSRSTNITMRFLYT